MGLKDRTGAEYAFDILHTFPFSSETKRMGIIVSVVATGKKFFILKGADNVMKEMITRKGASWLDEEVETYAREGLRTLVVAWKAIGDAEYCEWAAQYERAGSAMIGRDQKVRAVIDKLETRLELLALTGVEDKLQVDVQETLETMRACGVKVWMLTGDKLETAICIAISTSLKSRSQQFEILDSREVRTMDEAVMRLQNIAAGAIEKTVLVIDGPVLTTLLAPDCVEVFIACAQTAPAVVCCRCSPTQKAQVVAAVKKYTQKRTCSIGDGGNDVAMIIGSDVGVGIVGKEGKPLVLWHGRNAYMRSANLAQFVVHRGLVISTIQVIFTSIFYFIPLPVFTGWLVIGYATCYTMVPVFLLCMDTDLPMETVFRYPQLYDNLREGRTMALKALFAWTFQSIYQGGTIMVLAMYFFEDTFMNVVAITFTSLVASELLNVATQVRTWHPLMVAGEVISVVIYVYSMFILRSDFDIYFICTLSFAWRVAVITAASWVPVHAWMLFWRCVAPPQHMKLLEQPLDRSARLDVPLTPGFA